MNESATSRYVIHFGVFEVDLRAGELRKSGVRIKLQEQPFQVLAMLLQHPGEVVTREELQKAVWPADTFVDFDRGLNKAINKIREALGDSADNPRFVETLPRRGYRFIAPVNSAGAAAEPSPGPANAGPPSPTGRGIRGERVALAEPGPEARAVGEPPLRRHWAVVSTGIAALVAATLAYLLTRPLPPPKVLRYIQITSDAQGKVWYPWVSGPIGLATDGSRVYFMEGSSLAQVSATGGETVRIQPFPRDPSAALFDISPDRTELLVGGPRVDESTLWIQVLFDFTTQKWTELTKVRGVWNRWSRDGKYVYFRHIVPGPGAVFRVRVSDRTLERVVTLGDMRRAQGVFGDWKGLSPDDSILVTRDVGIQEVYALDVDWR